MSASLRGGRVVEEATPAAGRHETEEQVRIAAVKRRSLEESRRYSWIEDHLARLDGKEARAEYYAWLG